MAGHVEGQNTAIKLMKHIFTNTPIEVATFWWLSTENKHKRSQEELDYLADLYAIVLENIDDFLTQMKVNFRWIGNENGMPEKVMHVLKTFAKKHVYNTAKHMIIAINYGWRDEIIRGVQKLVAAGKKATEITAEAVSQSLDLGDLPPIELVIRSKGEFARRTSGFASWWIGYAELYFSAQYFPDLLPPVLDEALAWFDSIAEHRNYGK